MGDYLRVAVGPYQLLLDAGQVLEVVEDAVAAGAAGWRLWRGRSVPVLDMRGRLGLDEGDPGPLVISGRADGAGCRAVRVDRVVGLCRYSDASVRPLPPLPPQAGALFDGALDDAAGRLLLRCRLKES